MVSSPHEYFPENGAHVEVTLVHPEGRHVGEEKQRNEGEKVHGHYVTSPQVQQTYSQGLHM